MLCRLHLNKRSLQNFVATDVTKGDLKADNAKKSGLPSKAAPTSKLQLLKPSGLQRPSSLSKPADNLKKMGPMKAFAPVSQQKEEGLYKVRKKIAVLQVI